MVVIKAIAHKDSAQLAPCLNDQRPHPSRTFVPELIEGAQAKPCTGWMNLQKPPQNGCGALPFAVAVPLAQLINVGLIRLNFRHAEHANVFTAEDKDYALSLHRDICYGINSGQLPLQLLEILLTASRKAVLKPLNQEDPEYHHKEFELYLKRAIQRCKEDQSNGKNCPDDEEQTQEGAHAEEEHNPGVWSSEAAESASDKDDDSAKETPFLWTAAAHQPSHS
ncbi:hypothetical protein KCU85_g4525, partial [Aureobasidium melanogenum]